MLVVLVIFLFLQNWRSTLIPSITIPVSLIGTFAAMKLLGFSINTLTLFGLTLATGLVVDDAIVVLENIVRHIVDDKASPFDATVRAMKEISGAVLATSLVLMSVFIPVALLPGTTGLLYQQFALTMAASIAISLFTALTLAPVLAYEIVHGSESTKNHFMLWFEGRLRALTHWYEGLLPRLIARRKVVVGVFVLGLILLAVMFEVTPQGFIPAEDQSLLYVLVTLPVQASMDQTTAAVKRLEKMMLAMPQVEAVTSGIGFGFANNSSNQATMFVQLKPLSQRGGVQNSALALQYAILHPVREGPRPHGAAGKSARDPGIGNDRRICNRDSGHRQPRLAGAQPGRQCHLGRREEGAGALAGSHSHDLNGAVSGDEVRSLEGTRVRRNASGVLRYDQRDDRRDAGELLRLRNAIVPGAGAGESGPAHNRRPISRGSTSRTRPET